MLRLSELRGFLVYGSLYGKINGVGERTMR